MHFFQRDRADQAKAIEPREAESPPLLEEETKPVNRFKTIQLDNELYALLTQALRPEDASIGENLPVDFLGSNVPDVADEASGPPPANPRAGLPGPPRGTPIV